MMLARAGAATFVVAALALGRPCFGAGEVMPAQTAVGESPPVSSPLDAVFNGLAEFNLRLEAAQGEAMQACAESIGITSYVPLIPVLPAPVLGFGRFGLEDADVAARSGYVIDLGDDADVGDPAANLPPDQAAALNEAAFGPNLETFALRDPDGNELGSLRLGDGCLRQFYETFFGSMGTYVQYLSLRGTVENARIDATGRLQADAAFLALVEMWETCMSTAGFAVDVSPDGPALMVNGPGSAPSGPDIDTGESTGWPEPRPSDQEIDTAVADVGCKQATDFVPAATDLLIVHEQEEADEMRLAELDAELHDIYLSSGTQ